MSSDRQSSKHYRCFSLLWRALFIFFLLPQGVYAESNRKITLLHSPPEEARIPLPGKEITLSITVQGSDDIDSTARALVVSDGRLIDLPMTGEYDNQDHLAYHVSVPAPLGELTYQFLFYPYQQNTVVSSNRFAVRRPCIRPLQFKDLSIEKDLSLTERAANLIQMSKQLEDDLEVLSTVIEQINEIQALTREGGSQ